MTIWSRSLPRALVLAALFLAVGRGSGQEKLYSSFQDFYKAKQGTVPPPTGAQPQNVPAQPAPQFAAPPSAAVLPYNPYVQHLGPIGGGLTGAANVMNSQGQLMVDQQQAYHQREKVRQEKVTTRRKQFDEDQYERMMSPTRDQEREFDRVASVQRALNNPGVTEIWSAKALNDILIDLQLKQVAGSFVPLTAAVLKQINFSTSATGGSQGMGVFKNGKQLDWPEKLMEDSFAAQRKAINEMATGLERSIQSGTVNRGTVTDMTKAIDRLNGSLRAQVDTTEANAYIEAKRFLNDVSGSLKTLKNPEALAQLDTSWERQVRDVAGLVQQMTGRGLRFAPAIAGQEAPYQSLHSSLVVYANGVNRLVAQGPRGAPAPGGR